MKTDCEDDHEMREQYDFSAAVRNPYIQRFQELNLVSLDADVKEKFPNSQAVNTALRSLIEAGESETVSVELPTASWQSAF